MEMEDVAHQQDGVEKVKRERDVVIDHADVRNAFFRTFVNATFMGEVIGEKGI